MHRLLGHSVPQSVSGGEFVTGCVSIKLLCFFFLHFLLLLVMSPPVAPLKRNQHSEYAQLQLRLVFLMNDLR